MRVRDLDDAEYQRRMESLSRTFDMASRVLTSRGPSELDSFMAKYNIHDTCPRAVIRFIQGDLAAPAAAPGASTGVSAAVASSITHHLINLLDLLELEMTATDEVLPVLKELQQEVNKLVRKRRSSAAATFRLLTRFRFLCFAAQGTAFKDWPGKETCQKWHAKLMTMRASENMPEDDVRQLKMELSEAKTQFHAKLESL